MSGSAVVIIPTTGSAELQQCIDGVLGQSHRETCAYVVCDGPQFLPRVTQIIESFTDRRLRLLVLPENVGAGGYYGHRVFAGVTHLVNQDFILYLDQDNWFDRDHVASMIDLIRSRDLRWCYSLRRICDKQGAFITNDDCESLGSWPAWTGANHVDTNAYCLRRAVAVAAAGAWHGGWGQDRVFYATLQRHFPAYACTGRYSVNYRLGGNPGSVTAEFFAQGNAVMNQRFNGLLPWRRAEDS